MIRPLLCLSVTALSLGTALAEEPSLRQRAEDLHRLAGGAYCEIMEGAFVPEDAYSEWTFSYKPSWSEDAEEETITLIRIFCGSGAYNVQHAYYWYRQYEGLQPLPFAAPTYAARYVDDDIDAGLASLAVTGMGAVTTLVNSEFDPKTLTVHATSLWRGIGDASASGTWVFRDGEFALERYEIDASYDGEVNPEIVVNYSER